MAGAMEEEDAELEEGEAKEALDPETDFSYIERRLEMVLGECQKEFQGGNLSTEKLGSKYGGYGTFLPTQARIPSVLADRHPAAPAAEVARPVGEGVAAEPVKRSAGTSVSQVSVKENGGVSKSKQVKLKIKLGKQATGTNEAKRKALYNGLGLDGESEEDASVEEDDDNYSRSNVESPEPSPMAMIEMMSAPCPEGGLLSPLSDSTFENMDGKESIFHTHKAGNFSTATSNAYPPGSKVDLNSPHGSGLDYRKSKAFDVDKHTMDGKKGADFAAESNGTQGRKSRRDSDAEKPFVKERQSKSGRNDVVRVEQQDPLDDKGMEGFGKEEFDLVRDPSKSYRKHHLEMNKPPAVNGQKDKDVADGKGPGKSQASKVRESKEFSRSKAVKAQNLKENEVARMADSENDKGLTLPDARKQGKEESKITAPVRTKENSKEGFRENQKRDVAGDVKAKELVRDAAKPGSNPSSTKKTSSGVHGRKGVSHEHKSSKSAHEKKSSMKELEKDRMNLSEPVALKEEEKVPAVVEAAPASLVVPQLVLDNWVECDKCEQWRLLMPHVNPKPLLLKKWRCKMMDWLPGMNDCKFKEEETTAAVYQKLGYQNPALPAGTLPVAAAAMASAAPIAPIAPAPTAEPPVVEKWADEVDTKKNFLPKKGVARKLGGSVPKVAGGKGVDGAVRSKNDMGLDNSGDGTTVSDKHKPKAKEKVKRIRPHEGEDTRIFKKKVLQEQERNLEASQWSKEAMDVESFQGERERGETQGGGPGKRKKVGISEDLEETPNLKKKKGGRARLQFDDLVPSEEEYVETDKRTNVQKSKRESSMLRPKDVSHSGLHDKETQDINSVLKDLRENDGVPDRRREDRDQGRRSKGSEKQWRSKEDASDSEQRTFKKRRDDASYDRPNQASPREKPAYGREDFNRSTSSKVSNSSSGSLKGVGSPLESTVSSSPVRASNGKEEWFTRQSINAALAADIAMHSSPDAKHVRAASRGSSFDEGDNRHPGATHNTTRFAKQDSSGEARDDGWYDEEDRGVDRGHSHNHHPERHPHSSGDIDDMDGQQVRRKGNRERDFDRRRLDIRDNDHLDHSDHIAKDRNTRDERCRPPRESGPEKPGERSWEEDLKPDGSKYSHRRDDTSAQAHGARGGGPSGKETNRESDRVVSNVRKDGGAVEPSDTNKRPGASSNSRGGGDRGETLKREDLETGLVKSGEAATGSPAKRDSQHYTQAILSSNDYKKSATDLKHLADRLKHTDETGSTNVYLSSALQFLQSAAVLESVQRESTTNKSIELYRDTAGLCEYCGSQYNKRGDIRATALAYTCAAVARTRLMLCKKTSFANDCKEFQSAANLTSGPHMPSNGESPSSSSASDVDNLNKHHGIVPVSKASLGKAGIVSPQVPSGATINIPSRLRPVATRFLRDALDMSAVLESWQKAADATAKAEASVETRGMAAVKQVGELGGFCGDIDGVVRLVRVALDAIGH